MVRDRIQDASMNEPTPKRNIRPIVTTLTVLFCAAVFLSMMRGGMCERYERKMNRMDNMRHYIDSMRTEEQLKKIK